MTTENERRLLDAGDKLADALSVLSSDDECEGRAAMLGFDLTELLDGWEIVSGAIDPRL